MDFVKDLLQIQHLVTLHQVSSTILTDDLEKEQLIDKFNKRNYCLLKKCNCKMNGNCVKIDNLLSNLTL
jgi:hypothetical protein